MRARFSNVTSSLNFLFFAWTRRIASLSFMSGIFTTICLSNLPGLKSAGSNTSGLLVAAITMMPSLLSNPSISTSNWLRVCSLSSFPPPRPAPLWRPTASISSIKIMQGAFCFAWSNKSRTRLAPTPTNISTKSLPLILKKGTLLSPATAFASIVLPVPGGPTSSIPFGIRAPSSVYFFGFFKKSTSSTSSCFSSFAPATSENFTLLIWVVFALVLPKFILLLFCAAMDLMIINASMPINNILKYGIIIDKKLSGSGCVS